MADSSIILYVAILKGLISDFKKLGQRDLNKKIYKNLYKCILNF